MSHTQGHKGTAPAEREPLPVRAIWLSGQGLVGRVKVRVLVRKRWRVVIDTYAGGGMLSHCAEVHR